MKRVIYLFDSATSLKGLPVVRHLSERTKNKIETIAVLDKDISGGEEWKKFFDRFYIISPTKNPLDPCMMSLEEVAETIEHELTLPESTLIVPFGEYTSTLAAQLRERYSIPGHTVSQALPFRDKLKMKQLVKNNAKVPSFAAFDKKKYREKGNSYIEDIRKEVAFPFVIKPVNAASARATKIIYNKDFLHLIDEALEEFSGDFEVEEFIDGHMYTCEVLYKNGKPLLALSSKFNKPVIELAKGFNIGCLPLLPTDKMFKRLEEFCIGALSDLAIENGITHSEIFLNKNDELVFLETACRVPGGKVIESYMDAYGINILDIDQRLKIGLPIPALNIKPKQYGFWVVIPTGEGKIEKYIFPELESEYTIKWNYTIGDTTKKGKNFEEILAVLYAYNKDYSSLSRDFSKIDSMKFATYTN